MIAPRGPLYYPVPSAPCGKRGKVQDPSDPRKWYCGTHARRMHLSGSGSIAAQAAELNALLK